MSEALKLCSCCRRPLPVTSFHRRRHYVRGGLRAACRECTSTKAKARRELAGTQHDRDKELVRARTRSAVARGVLARGPCVDCGAVDVEAHHPDYVRADAHLVVEWLCRLHHAARHGTRPWTRQLELVL